MVYGYMLESNKHIMNDSLIESFYYKLYDQINSENSSFRKIVESLVVLEKNYILNEEDQTSKDKTLMDKIKAIFKKVCLFFKKIKNEFYEKFIKLGYNQLKKAKGKYTIPDNFEDRDENSNQKFYSDYEFKMISQESLNQYNEYINVYNNITDELDHAYNNDDLEAANKIDFSRLPNVEINMKEEKLSFRTNGSDNRNDNLYGIYNAAMINLDNAKNEIEGNFKILDNGQNLLSKSISSKDISHNQMIILSKMIDFMNKSLKLSYKFVNASIRTAMACCKQFKPIIQMYNQYSGGVQ